MPLMTFNSELLYMQVWFTDQNSQPVEIEYRINLTLVSNWYTIKMHHSVEPRDWIYVKSYGFLYFAKNIGQNVSGKHNQNLLIVLKNIQQTQ